MSRSAIELVPIYHHQQSLNIPTVLLKKNLFRKCTNTPRLLECLMYNLRLVKEAAHRFLLTVWYFCADTCLCATGLWSQCCTNKLEAGVGRALIRSNRNRAMGRSSYSLKATIRSIKTLCESLCKIRYVCTGQSAIVDSMLSLHPWRKRDRGALQLDH